MNMINQIVNTIKKIRRRFHSFIYRNFISIFKKTKEKPVYNLVTFVDEKGNFDYEKYKQRQIAGNHKKLDVVWVSELNIKFLSEWLKKHIPNMSFGVCHGTRNGAEQNFFKIFLNGVDIIGTEISDTANQFPDTIQWDFHEINPSFSKKADFVYSNSFDHAYDPKKAINAWLDSLKNNEDSVCILEHSSGHSPDGVSELDPFGADIEIMPSLVKEWTDGKYEVREILRAPDIRISLTDDRFLIIGKVKTLNNY